MLDVRKLVVLREVALRGGVVGAGPSLGVSASNVSQQISRLEKQYGVALLEPRGRGVRLTAAAERLVLNAERVLAALEEAEGDLMASRGAVEGTVQLATFHTFATGFLAATTQRLRRIAPSLTLRFDQIDSEDALEELTARRVDIVVVDEYPGHPIPPTPGLVRSVLGRERIRVYAPEGMAGAPDSAPWAMEPSGTDARRWALSVCRSAGFEPCVQFESPDPYVHRRLVEQGLAMALLPDTVADGLNPLEGWRVGSPSEMRRTLLAFVRRGSERAPAVRACRMAIEGAVKGTLEIRDLSPSPGVQTEGVE